MDEEETNLKQAPKPAVKTTNISDNSSTESDSSDTHENLYRCAALDMCIYHDSTCRSKRNKSLFQMKCKNLKLCDICNHYAHEHCIKKLPGN